LIEAHDEWQAPNGATCPRAPCPPCSPNHPPNTPS
jgi:hypothetical protein